MNTVVWDLSNKTIFTWDSISLILFFILFGIFSKMIFLYKPKKNWISLIYNFSNEFYFKGKLISNFMFAISVFISILILGNNLKEIFYTKNIGLFEKEISTSGIINKIEYEDYFGYKMIFLDVNNYQFTIIPDERYVSNRSLIVNDSIKVNYFKKYEKNNNSKLVVTRIELIP